MSVTAEGERVLKNTRTRKRFAATVALGVLGALLLSACSQGIGMNRVAEGTVLRVGVLDTATTVNAYDASLGNPLEVSSSAEQFVNNLMYTPVAMRTVPTVTFNTEFISVSLVETSPLTVRYSLQEGMAWSDAVPTDDADLLLAWAASSEHFAPDGFDRSENLTGDGQLNVPSGTAWFDSAWSPMQEGTELARPTGDNRTIDVEYSQPVQEWEHGIRSLLPAHIVGQHAFGISDPMRAKHAVKEAITSGDTARIAQLAQSYRSLFSLSGSPSEGAWVSNGQYMLDSVDPRGTVTLKPNKEYRMGNGAVAETVQVIPYESSDELVQALRTAQIDVAVPQTSMQNWQTIAQLDRRGYRALSGNSESFARLDFNLTAGANDLIFANRGVRQAFLSAISLSDVSAVATEAIEGVTTRNTWVFPPNHEESSAAAETSGVQSLSALDEDASDERLEQAGITDRDVCVLYDSRNEISALQFVVMQTAAQERGWTLEDCGREDWQDAMQQPDQWDVAITIDNTSALNFATLAERFRTDGELNFTGLSSAEIDSAIDTAAAEADVFKRLDALIQLEELLMEQAVGIPLYQVPVIAAHSDAIVGAAITDSAPYIGQDAFGWEVSR